MDLDASGLSFQGYDERFITTDALQAWPLSARFELQHSCSTLGADASSVTGGMLAAAELTMPSQQHELLPTVLQSSLPNADERPRSATEGSVPAHVRAIGVALTDDDHGYIRRKLVMRLGKFARSMQRISVRVTDLNGPRGGVDQVCSIKVVLSGLPSVVVTRRDAAVQAAIDAALHAIEQAVHGIVGRRRMKPLRNRVTRVDAWRL